MFADIAKHVGLDIVILCINYLLTYKFTKLPFEATPS